MGLDLGTLSAQVSISTGGVTSELNRVRKALQDVEKQTDKLSNKKLNVDANAGGIDKANTSAKKLSKELENVSKAGSGAKVSGQPAQELDKAAGAGGRLKNALSELGNVGALVGVGTAAAGVTAAFGAALRLGNEFTNNLNTMQAVSGATAPELSAVGAAARALGNDTSLANTSASDAAAAMSELAKGGFSVDQSMQAAKGTLQLAAAAGIDAASAATIQSQALQAFGLNADYAAKSSDVLANAANASSAEITGIAQGLQQSGAVANQFGLTLEDTAATLGMLANAGIQGSDAGTLLKSTLLALTDTSEPAQNAINELGLTVYDAQGKFVGMSSLMGQLDEASKSMTEEQYQAATATLFGSDAMRLAGVAAEQGQAGFDKMRDAMEKQGAAADVAAAKTQGLPGAIAAVQNASEELALSLYDKFSGPLEGALDGVAGGISGVGSAMGAVPAPVFAGALALVGGRLLDVNGKMNSGTGALRSFGAEMRNNQAFFGAMGRDIGTVTAGLVTLEQRSPGMSRLANSVRDNSAPLMMMGTQTRLAATEMTGMGRVSMLAQGHIQTLGGAARGAAAGGMSALKMGASGLMGVLGGPWGIAIAGATTVLGILAQKHQEAAQKEAEHKAYQDQLRGSLDETTGAMTKQSEQMALDKLRADGLVEAGAALGLTQDTMAQAATGNAAAQSQVFSAIQNGTNTIVRNSGFWEKYGADAKAAGLSVDDFADALNGSEEAQNKLTEAFRNNPSLMGDTWRKYKDDLEDANKSTHDLSVAMGQLGQDASKVQTEQQANALRQLSEEAGRAAGVMDVLGDKAAKIGSDPTKMTVQMDEAAAADTKAKLDAIGVASRYNSETQTLEIEMPNGAGIIQQLNSLGNIVHTLPNGRIDLKSNTAEEKQKFVELGLAVKDPVTGEIKMRDDIQQKLEGMNRLKQTVNIDGKLYMKDNVGQVQASLAGLGIKAQMLPPGNVRVIDNADQVKGKLDLLGVKTVTLPDGRVVITDNTPETNAKLTNVGAQTSALPPGFIQITDTSAENLARLEGVGIKTKTLPNGKVVITDNAQTTAENIRRTLSSENTNTQSSHEISIIRRITDIFTKSEGGVMAFADGGYSPPVERYADGGQREIQRAREGKHHEPPHTAQIAPAGAWRLFAEPETGGEAYIPLAQSKRARSEKILGQVAQRFGYQLTNNEGQVQTFANGGVVENLKNIVAKRFPELQVTSDYRQSNDLHGAGKAIDISNGFDTTPQMQEAARWFYRNYKTQLAELIHYPLNGWQNVDEGKDFDFGAGTNAEHRNHVHIAAHQPLTGPTPPVGNAGLDGMFDGLDGVAGGKKTGSAFGGSTSDDATTTKSEKTINGGKGTLIKDGSFLELVAAVHSKQTGYQYGDDIVSWGQVAGLYTEEDSEDAAKDAEKAAKKAASAKEKLEKAKENLPLAEEDLRIAKMNRDETYNKTDKNGKKTATDTQKAAADQRVAKAEKRVDDLNKQIEELEAQIKELEAAAEINPYEGLDSNLPNVGTSGNKYADAIIREGRRRRISDRGIKIALATALVESNMKMYANPNDPASMRFPHDAVGSDHDSVGLFQQRNNGAWGTTADRMDPARSAGMFYDKLDDADYNHGDPGAHAQRVQASAFPDRYNTKMGEAQAFLSRYNAKTSSITPMANGGILGHARGAQIQDGSSAVLWAEAGPEAYIPLSKKGDARATDIWMESGRRLGYDVAGLLNLVGSGIPGLVEGKLDFSTGSSISADRMGLNMDAASYRGQRGVQNAVGAVFNGPVQINDPRQWAQGQLNNATKSLGSAMKAVIR